MIKLECPHCGAHTDQWRYLEDAATSRELLERVGDTLHVAANYTVEHPAKSADEKPRFVCSCGTVIQVPKSLRLVFDD